MSKRSRCGAVQFVAREMAFASRGLRACFRIPAVAGSIFAWSAAAPA